MRNATIASSRLEELIFIIIAVYIQIFDSFRFNRSSKQCFTSPTCFLSTSSSGQHGVSAQTPIEYFKVDDDSDYKYSKALPKKFAACLQMTMDFGVDSVISRATVKFSDVSKAIVTQFQSGSTIELAAADQELFDIRIIQPIMDGKQMLCIFEQHENSDDHNQNHDQFQKWMGTNIRTCLLWFDAN
jgi:hypothetical protein